VSERPKWVALYNFLESPGTALPEPPNATRYSTTRIRINMARDHSAFIEAFFLASDNGADHAGYVENFAADATLKMGLKTAVGGDRK
jgi:hypothetical protein